MSITRNLPRLAVALLTSALVAVGGAGLPAATAATAPAAVAPAAGMPATRSLPAAIIPATGTSSAGTDYWVTFQRNASTSETTFLYLTGATATTGDVNWAGTDTPFSVTPGQVTTVTAPTAYNTAVMNESTDGTTTRLGVHITAADAVTAYGLNYAAGSSDAFLGIPTPGLGTRYRAVSAPQTNNGVGTAYGPSRILVVGTVDGTTVSITPSGAVRSHPAGTTYTVSLNRGDVYTVATNSTTAPANNVTGTLITSDNPVAVFAGVDNAIRPAGSATQDQQAQELAPTTEWGTDFLASRFDSLSAGTPLTIVADTDGTNVTLDGGSPIALNAGDSYSTTVANSGDSAVVIHSDNPVEVEQYMVNNSYNPGTEPVTGDPSAMLLPPITQWLSSYTFATPGTGFAFNAVNIVVPQADTHAVSLDGTTVSSDDFTDIPNTTDAVAQELLTAGTHNVSAADPFGIYVYGANAANSYAYPGGSAFSVPGPVLTPQTITFTGPADTPLADGTTTVSATSDSGLTVTFTSTTPGVCTVSGTTVTLVDHGTCTIDADQAGDGTYAPAATVARSFTVTEPQTISFTQPADADLADGTASLSATATGGGTVTFTSSTTSVCTVTGSTVTLLTAGTCTIAADQAGGGGVQAAPTVTRSFAVLADQTITFTGPADTDLATGTVTLSATSSSTLPVSFTSSTPAVCTVSGTTVTLVSSGTCSIAADQTGNAGTEPAPTVTRSFYVLADQTISFPQPADADVAAGTVTVSASAPGGAVTFTSSTPSVCTISGSTVTLVTTGTCTITAHQAGTPTTAAAPTVTRTFQVKVAQTITFAAPADTPLAAGTVTLTASAPGGAVTFTTSTPAVCTVSGSTVALVAHGTCTVTANQAGDATHLPAPAVTHSFTVTEPQTISFPQPADAALSSGTVVLTATAPGGPVSFSSTTPSVCTVSGTTVTLVGNGTCTVTANQAGGDGVSAAAAVTRSFQVKTAQAITFARPTGTALGSGPVTLTASSTSGLPITFSSATPQVCTVSGDAVTLRTAGTCTIAADAAGNASYLAAPTVSQSFVVTPAPAAPTIVTNPVDVSVQAGATATFTAAATGYPTPTVAWQVLAPGGSWTDIAGATGVTFTTGPLGSAQNGTKYRAVFTNVNGSVATAPATATVSVVGPPAAAPLVLLSQTLWGHIEIAAHSTRIPFTIRFNQSRPSLSVVLTDNRTHKVLGSTTVRPAHPGTSFSGEIVFGLGAVHRYGSYTWTLTTHGGGPARTFVLKTSLRQHSTLTLNAQRRGTLVTLTGSAHVFNVRARSYKPWANRVVLIQVQTANGWVTIARTRTGSRGQIDAQLRRPQHLTLRVVDLDTAIQWGRTSDATTI